MYAPNGCVCGDSAYMVNSQVTCACMETPLLVMQAELVKVMKEIEDLKKMQSRILELE